MEWASRPHNASPLKGKPVLILTSSVASTGGVRAQYQIRETLASSLARATITPEIVVGGIQTKMAAGRFQDPATISFALTGLAMLFEDIVRMTKYDGIAGIVLTAPPASRTGLGPSCS